MAEQKKINSLQPQQELALDEEGVLRFRNNAMVEFLLDNGGIDINHLASIPFSKEDRMQFAQLIGYSLSGYGDLPYVTDISYDMADLSFNNTEENLSKLEIENKYLKKELERKNLLLSNITNMIENS